METKDEFVTRYCNKSNISRDTLFSLGLVVVPCQCGDSFCSGWQLMTKDQFVKMFKSEEAESFDLDWDCGKKDAK